ncbi:MAG: tetratricopeptide repeat protein [Pseudomonadota bacterium]
MVKRYFTGVLLASSLALLAACDSAEERAEGHFQTALEFIEDGDFSRATIEFRNVFKLNGNHHEARLAFARMLRENRDFSQSYSQFLRLVEQDPQNLEGQLALAQMAIELGNWEEAERHGKAAFDLAPDNPEAQAAKVALDYRDAVQDQDAEARQGAVEAAQGLLEDNPTSFAAQQVVIDHSIREQDWPAARAALDSAIASVPSMQGLYVLRLSVLNEMGEMDEVEAQFKDMIARFPEDEANRRNFLQWYLSQGNLDGAEAFLRDQIDPEEDSPDARLALVSFLAQARGAEAARAELDQQISSNPDMVVLRTLRAALAFDQGDTEAARTELEEVLAANPAPTSPINDAKITLARIDFAEGNTVGARARVEEVLEADPSHVEAMKMKAGWLVDDDQTGDAIIILREALGHSPRDADIMTLLASAHERNGSRTLMAEMLSLAVEASGNAPAESLRYANFLSSDDKALSAEDVLLDALRLQPQNQELLGALGVLYLNMQDWGRADGVITRLGQLENGTVMANELNARKLAAQGQEEDLIAFLEGLSTEGGGTKLGLIRAHISRGNVEAALTEIDSALAETPNDLSLRFVRGSVLAGAQDFDAAEATFRAILEEAPQSERGWLALYRLKRAAGEPEAASGVLDEALTALPEAPQLLWTRAGEYELAGNIDGAIEIYESLYARNSSNLIIANNLASLLSTHQEDADSLQRAWQIGRRLQGSDVPAFQDTYGWIAYQRGDLDAALAHLEPAAEGIPDDPRVQYHLGATYAALGNIDAALAQFQKVTEMPGNEAIIETVTAEIARLTELKTNATQEETGN